MKYKLFLFIFLIASVFFGCKKEDIPQNTILPTDYWSYLYGSGTGALYHPIQKWVKRSADYYFTGNYYNVYVRTTSDYTLIMYFNEQPSPGNFDIVGEYSSTSSNQMHMSVFVNGYEMLGNDYAISGSVEVSEVGNGTLRFVCSNAIMSSGRRVKADITIDN